MRAFLLESRVSRSALATTFAVLAWIAAGPSNGNAAFTGDEPSLYERPTTMWAVESQIHLARKRWESAIETLSRALHDQPDNVRLVQKLADVYIRLERYAEAIRVIEDFLPNASRRNNLYYMLGYAHDRLNHFREALGYYTKALRIDPGKLSIYVRAAQIRLRQGLVFDAAKVLRKALEIDRDYAPAVEELAIVNKLIKMNRNNVYRRGNLVVLFRDFKQFPLIDRLYPALEQHRTNIETNLQYHVPLLWVKIVKKIDHHENPPALNNWTEDVLLVTEETLQKQDHAVIAHEMVYLYLTRLTENNAPRWLVEGMALWESRPKFLSNTPLRSTENSWPEEMRFLSAEKKYLDFEKQPDGAKRQLVRSFALFRFLLDNYGWEGMRRIFLHYREGDRRFSTVAWQTLHIPLQQLIARWNVYVITNFYFNPTTETSTWNTSKGPGNT